MRLIIKALDALNEKNGSSRQSIKKFIQAHDKSITDNEINLSIRKGIIDGIFSQPKGVSGPIKYNFDKNTIDFATSVIIDCLHNSFIKPLPEKEIKQYIQIYYDDIPDNIIDKCLKKGIDLGFFLKKINGFILNINNEIYKKYIKNKENEDKDKYSDEYEENDEE